MTSCQTALTRYKLTVTTLIAAAPAQAAFLHFMSRCSLQGRTMTPLKQAMAKSIESPGLKVIAATANHQVMGPAIALYHMATIFTPITYK